MSYDQKPGKMRVVGSSSAAPQRRRGDETPGAVGAVASVPGGAPAAADAAAAAGQPGKSMLLVGIIFIAGCAIGGAALPLLGIV